MTIAQVVALADVEWPASTETPGPAGVPMGTGADLLALASLQQHP